MMSRRGSERAGAWRAATAGGSGGRRGGSTLGRSVGGAAIGTAGDGGAGERQRKIKLKDGSLARAAVALQHAAKLLRQPARDGQPQAQAQARVARRIVHLKELVKQVFLVQRADAAAGIG